MLDPEILKFFEDKGIVPEKWLPDAAKRAKRIFYVTHPGKFTNPSTSITRVVSDMNRNEDGYLRSGNAVVDMDFDVNAADLRVHAFLMLLLSDSKSMIEHIKNNTEQAKKLFSIVTENYQAMRDDFLSLLQPKAISQAVTSKQIKQVFFPVADDYHMLSLLTNSGMVFSLKNRINEMNFSDQAKESKELKKNNLFCANGYSKLTSLVVIKYGGSNPQNISVLNKDNNGEAYLLMSLPPNLNEIKRRFPRKDFFREVLWVREFNPIFQALHVIFMTNYNNINIREGRDYHIEEVIDLLVNKVWEVRACCAEQYLEEKSQLQLHQKIWLCDTHKMMRDGDGVWLDSLFDEITRWIVFAYEKSLGKSAVKLDDHIWNHIHKIVVANKEALL